MVMGTPGGESETIIRKKWLYNLMNHLGAQMLVELEVCSTYMERLFLLKTLKY